MRNFWLEEYEGYNERQRSEYVAPIQNKVGAFLSDPILRKILTQKKSSFDLRQVIDNGQLFLVNLAKGMIGAESAALLGSLIISRLELMALTRADTPESMRRDPNRANITWICIFNGDCYLLFFLSWPEEGLAILAREY